MKLNSLIKTILAQARSPGIRKQKTIAPPVLGEALRHPYGPFRFRFLVPPGVKCAVFSSTDLGTWTPIGETTAPEGPTEYVDSEAFKFSWRFYRVCCQEVWSANVIGYVSVSLPPGFSLLANPFQTECLINHLFKDWPDGTTLHRFDTSLFRLVENEVKDGLWTNPSHKLAHGEGIIFYNPTFDYRWASFVGEVAQGTLLVPIPSGFSIRSSPVPKAGTLEDLGFPIAEGDVIHVFDREGQKYLIYPYKDGKWPDGQPTLSVGEAFWVAKTVPGNWTRSLII
jgi:hypothetical protein